MKHTVFMDDVHVSSYANLVLLQRLYTQLENRRWVKERKAFLIRELNEKGKLVCHYCHRDNLKLKSPKRHEQATVDHVLAKSAGGDAYDPANFVVCCNSCNQRKASHSVLDFMNSKYIKNKKQSNGTI
jgi:5-methylcytosine-specific restriction endonuclease McrA